MARVATQCSAEVRALGGVGTFFGHQNKHEKMRHRMASIKLAGAEVPTSLRYMLLHGVSCCTRKILLERNPACMRVSSRSTKIPFIVTSSRVQIQAYGLRPFRERASPEGEGFQPCSVETLTKFYPMNRFDQLLWIRHF